MTVVVAPADRTFRQRIENGIARFGLRLHRIDDIAHGNAGPLRNTGPALDAKMGRSIHFLSFLWFILFILAHGIMVFITGLRENTNHMFAGVQSAGWVGFPLFVLALVLIGSAWWRSMLGSELRLLEIRLCSASLPNDF